MTLAETTTLLANNSAVLLASVVAVVSLFIGYYLGRATERQEQMSHQSNQDSRH